MTIPTNEQVQQATAEFNALPENIQAFEQRSATEALEGAGEIAGTSAVRFFLLGVRSGLATVIPAKAITIFSERPRRDGIPKF